MLYPNMTTTAMFLSCTQPPTTLLPVTQTTYTTVYETVMQAACPTSQWMTTYTVTDTYTGNPTNYVTPTIPQGYVVTTVVCPGCKPMETMTVTQPAETYPVSVMTSNGITTTLTVTPTATPSMGSPATYATGTKSAGSTVTAVPATPGYPGSGPSYPVPCSGSGCSSSGGNTTPKPPASCGGSGCKNGTYTTVPPAVVTAGAPPRHGAFELLSGLVLLAGHFFLL
ncbi:hypothetical protein F4821DRAFT_255701 [Hypoxylon rubiginosum]|uniref:Uncharacterized protein n=1 Tax=Hypoxylon rubiginosum TaxID=110542 RepID=A0ACC0DE50_9PEZI|nr:hypothetical protein F4821DRAFT_255701 [Hypoxylon rubiginosum]